MSRVCPSASEPCLRFLEKLLRLKASERISAEEVVFYFSHFYRVIPGQPLVVASARNLSVPCGNRTGIAG